LADSRYYDGGPGYYHDNTGSFSVTVEALPLSGSTDSAAPANPPVAATPVKVAPATTTYLAAPDAIPLARDGVFGYALPPGSTLSHDIQASPDLIHWGPATNVSLYFRDWDSTNLTRRFYRFGQ
jgi:hypothetical protein